MALSVVPEIGQPLIDQETGEELAFYRTSDLSIDFTVFDAFDNPIDVSDLTYVEADFVDDPGRANILAQSTIPGAASLFNGATIGGWRDGTQTQGTFEFSTDQLAALQGRRRVWLVFRALTVAGKSIVLGAGWVSARGPGVPARVFMPLTPVPLVIPLGAVYVIPPGVTINFPNYPQVFGAIVLSPAVGDLSPGAMTVTPPGDFGSDFGPDFSGGRIGPPSADFGTDFGSDFSR